jgi:hypothetical protein
MRRASSTDTERQRSRTQGLMSRTIEARNGAVMALRDGYFWVRTAGGEINMGQVRLNIHDVVFLCYMARDIPLNSKWLSESGLVFAPGHAVHARRTDVYLTHEHSVFVSGHAPSSSSSSSSSSLLSCCGLRLRSRLLPQFGQILGLLRNLSLEAGNVALKVGRELVQSGLGLKRGGRGKKSLHVKGRQARKKLKVKKCRIRYFFVIGRKGSTLSDKTVKITVFCVFTSVVLFLTISALSSVSWHFCISPRFSSSKSVKIESSCWGSRK